MANMSFTNNAATTLASGITNVATSLTVASGTGALFPALSGSQYFWCTLANNAGTVEIVKVTARSTDTFTITRAQDNTSAVSWSSGDKVELRLVAAALNDLPKLDEANTFASGVTQTIGTLALTNALTVANGGTGQTTYTNGQLLIGNTTGNTLTKATLTAGTGISITNGAGSISIAASGGTSVGISATTFTSSGTFTIPTGVTKIKMTIVGGGGNGSAGTTSGSNKLGGGGGGGGGAAIKYLTGLTPGNTLTVTVGSAGNTSSVASGTQSITTVSATGNGGLGSSGDINIRGGAGTPYLGAPTTNGGDVRGGIGGSSIMGGGGGSGQGGAGGAGGAYGGGGGGGGFSGGCCGSAAGGGAGAAGVVLIEYDV